METAPTFRGRNIFDIVVPRSGVQFSFDLEWRLAAHFAGYRFEDFILLQTENQAHHIAAYRCYTRIEAVVEQVRAKEAKARAKPKGKA